jgi:hypothetical protein
MLKIKNILPVFVVLLFLGVASTAFAQVSCNVASTPVSRDTSTGLTEPAGDITLQCTQTGANPSGAGATVTVTYGVPITNDTTFPVNPPYAGTKPIAVANTVAAGCPAPTSTTVSNAAGSVVIAFPAIGNGPASTCNYTLSGVLLALSGSGATSVSATVSVSPGNNLLITAGQNTPTVVTSVLAPIVASGVVVKTGPGIVPTTGVNAAFASGFSIAVTENYIDMFRDVTQFNSGAASNGTQLVFTFAGIPTGASFPCSATSTAAGVADGTVTPAAGAAATVNATTPTVTVAYTAGAGPSLTAIDTITLTCGPFSNGSATLPFAAGSITATVSLAPIGTAFSAVGAILNNPTTTGQIPRYTGPSFGPLTVINIIPLTTHMIFPFVAVGNGFDTGLVIANTTADPYGGTKFGGAAAVSGPITIAFFPSGGGTPFCVQTGSGAAAVAGITSCTTVTAGTGLSSGSVASGSSWSVLSSQLFSAAGVTASFSGYAFAIANFPFAHPTAFVADATFSGKFASGGPMLVLQNPAVAGRSVFPTGGLAESLGH